MVTHKTTCRYSVVMVCLAEMIVLASARGASVADQEFEVALIRPKDPATLAHPRTLGPLVFDGFGTVKDFIGLAYKLEPSQIAGGPEWTGSVVYYVRAKAPSESSPDMIRNMLASLLRTRFQLRLHDSSKTMSSYVLKADPKGAKLKASKEGTPRDGAGAIQKTLDGAIGHGSTTTLLANFITIELGQFVVDSTGLDGIYDFDLKYDLSQTPDGSSPEFGSIFAALKEVGLRLESKKTVVPIVIIDGAEYPSSN